MRKILIYLICGLTVFFILFTSGCVTPPKETTTTTSHGGGPNAGGSTAATTGTQNYLTQATPFPTESAPYRVIPTTAPVNQQTICLIGLTWINATFSVYSAANSFDLKNPPMFINYTIQNTTNETGLTYYESKYGGGGSQSATYSYYSPYSYLEITVRNKTTGEIYVDDGFGTRFDYYLNKTFKVANRDDVLIEMKAFNLTATVGVWVKPDGNDINATGLECQGYYGLGPNILVPPTAVVTTAPNGYYP
jgi:hypothetical protein